MSDAAIRLRPLRWWDIEPIVVLERALFGRTAWSAAQFWGELAAPGRGYLVAERDGSIVGYAGIAVLAPDADVQTVAVAESARGTGLGRRLLHALLDRARAEGARRVLLEVAADNAAARGLYHSMGFDEIARRRDYYGPGADALVMRTDLASAPRVGAPR